MPFQIETMRDPPAIYILSSKDFDLDSEILEVSHQAKQILDAVSEPAFCILDLQMFIYNPAKFFEFQEFTYGRSNNIYFANFRMGTLQVMKHPRTCETLLITQNPVVRFAARGMNMPVFGNIVITVFDSLDATLAYARKKSVSC